MARSCWGLRFESVSRRRRLLLRIARVVPCVNHRPSVDLLIAALGAGGGGLAYLAGVRPEIAVPTGIVTAFLLAALCNAIQRALWNFSPGLPPPPDPGDPSGDFEPRRPLVPAGAGAVALPEPQPEQRISARPRILGGR